MTQVIKDAFSAARDEVSALVASGHVPDAIVQRHADAADDVLRSTFERAVSEVGGESSGVALLALGGYGRRELTPGSDLDLLLLHRGWAWGDIAALNRALIYPLWDSGRELGDRVREPKDVFKSLERIDEACALLDARFLIGDKGLFTELMGSLSQRMERGRASFFGHLVAASAERHARFGHAGHLLEPNVRDSAGGLRDIHTLGWAAKVLPGAEGLSGLVESGHLVAPDLAEVERARSFLLGARLRLHLLTGRHQDQLYLAEQDEIAALMGYPDQGERPAADALMQELYRHARIVEAITGSFWERVTRRKPRRLWRGTGAQSARDGCVVSDGRLEVVAVTHPRDDPAAWLRVFRRSVREGVAIGRVSINRLRQGVRGVDGAERNDPPVGLTWTPEAREIFLDILQSGTDGTRALEAMDAAGFLSALIPEWDAVRCLPQRDLYHRFTVDVHLFAVVSELASSRTSQEPDARDAWARITDPEAVFVAALLHDIGKGRGGDHSEIGATLASQAARRMEMEPEQIETIEFLVRDHLTLAELAIRRDFSDPQTLAAALERIGDVQRLAMLFLLTRADSMATGPEAWSSFRSALVRELYGLTLRALEGQPVAASDVAARVHEFAAALDLPVGEVERLLGPMPESWTGGFDPGSARRQLATLAKPLEPAEVRTAVHKLDEAHELILVAADRPGLFATVCGVLALRGIDVHDAEIYTRADGVAVEVFRVIGTHGEVPEERWRRIAPDVRAAQAGELDLDEGLSRKSSQERRRRRPRRKSAAQIVVDNSASAKHTIVEVHTEDRLGLLRDVTKTLYEQGCDLSLAKVATYGVAVVDVFYVLDLDGRKITDTEHLERIEKALLRLFPSA